MMKYTAFLIGIIFPTISFGQDVTISADQGKYTVSSNLGTLTINEGVTVQGSIGNAGIDNFMGYTIQTINNYGSVHGLGLIGDIGNSGIVTTFNNSQHTGSSRTLLWEFNLPINYNIIIRSPTNFGQIDLYAATGSTSFGIASGSSITTGTYQSVLKNFNLSNLNNTSGQYNGFSWDLIESNVSGVWDLIITGVSTVDTQASLYALASKLRGAFSSQTMATNFANMNTYDCNLFDAKGLCVSVGGQQTYVDSPSANMTSAVVVAGYKVSPTFRIGGFLNQNVNSNTGSNVDISNNSPLMGLFAVWNQNENHLGYQVKIANAYQDMDVTTTRDVIGTSEAGRGKTDLNTQSYVGELSYAFLTNDDKTLVRPYAAVRYTRIKQDGYTERTTSDVTAPLTYAALSDRSTAALVGVKLNHKLTDKVNLTGSLGVEQDLNHDVDNLTASGVSGLTSEAFNNNINRTRPVASIGAYYMPVKNQRIAADIYYQQLPFQSTASTTAYVNYMIGF